MLEAKIQHAVLLKRIIDALKELVTQANLDCSPTGIALQAMDQSHVSLVALLLSRDGFQNYRCDRPIPLGIQVRSLSKILKIAGNDDNVTIKAEDNGDTVSFTFEGTNKVSEFELKLMEVDGEALAIPEREYEANIQLPSAQFQKICRDLSAMGESVTIEASKEGIKFSVTGEMGGGNILLRPTSEIDAKDEEKVNVQTSKTVALSFGIKFLNFFTKATPLSPVVRLSMTDNEPIAIEYPFDLGYIRYYLAPKIEDEDE